MDSLLINKINSMKKKIFVILGVALMGIAVFHGIKSQGKASGLSNIQLANLEALSGSESDFEITCSGGDEGQCFKESLTSFVVCDYEFYRTCEYSGYQTSFCFKPPC